MSCEIDGVAYDRSLLTEPLFEFVIVSDTHYMLDQGGKQVEFTSRLKQSARAETAYRHISALHVEWIIHLGDLVQEYPDTSNYRRAMDEARQQIEQCGLSLKMTPGNHDVGDKPDDTMPTSPVTRESMDWYHQEFGPSWHSFTRDGCRFVILNSQIMNTAFPEAAQQRSWLERELAEHAEDRFFLFLHLPPYLWDEHELSLGHYENLGQEDRAWLLDLVRRYPVELLFAGHVHTSFYDRCSAARYFVANSTSFTRPGFCHMYTSGPLPERGRDDAEKLGFYLCRVFEDRTDIHFIRTHGATEIPEAKAPIRRRLITRTSAGFEQARVGISLRQAITPVAEVPLAWPASIREQIRNDYPLLACAEMGITCARTQWTDFQDPFQRRRLEILRDEGIRLTATSIWSSSLKLPQLVAKHAEKIDCWEVQTPGSPWPSDDCLRDLEQCTKSLSVPITLSAVVPGEVVAGKQHPRTRLGYKVDEIVELNRILQASDIRVARTACVVSAAQSPWSVALRLREIGGLSHVGEIDLLVSLSSLDDDANAARSAEAMLAAAMLPRSRVYFDPLLDLDRSMDTCNGLLDTICNPRPAFHIIRCLNSLLFADPSEDFQAVDANEVSVSIRTLRGVQATFTLVLPSLSNKDPSVAYQIVLPEVDGKEEVRLFRLVEGSVAEMTLGEARQTLRSGGMTEPVLLVSK